MATGILMVLVYLWSGESVTALVLSIVTLFAVLAIIQWKPWEAGLGEPGDGSARAVTGRTSLIERNDGDVWRSTFDITWDLRGVSGVALGARAPQMWAWSRIDDISHDWCPPIDGGGADDDEAEPMERVGLRLDFPDLRNPEEPAHAWVMFGPDQAPDEVVTGARIAWRESKITQSRFHDLSSQERTLRLADHFARSPIDLTGAAHSPELLYQEIRRALLASGELVRLAPDTNFDDALDAFDLLLEANGADLLSQSEADELAAADGPNRVASLHWTLDWAAEQRGFRVAFIDQGGEDYLLGLVPAGSADDWDGQTVGSGSTRVVLDLPM